MNRNLLKRIRCLAVVGGLACACVGGLLAQEITLGEISACLASEAPEQLPQIRGKWSIRPPDELRAAVGPEFVFLQLVVKLTGELEYAQRGTNSALNRCLGRLNALKLLPARTAGKPVVSYVWLPLIFNPANAAVGARDAIPRVLAVGPVVVPHELFMELKLGQPNKHVAWATASLDASGQLQRISLEAPADGRLQPLVEQALRQWRFAPARADGQPVAAELRVPVVLFTEKALQRPGLRPGGPVDSPKVTKQVAPDYPPEMKASGIVGRVVLSIVVNAAGKVENPVVVESNGPAFNQPAIKAVLAWRFEPARQNGKPVPMTVQIPVVFAPRGLRPL